ncbi:MAG: PspC domain-containing protein [Candidatus Nanopelagicales bacterium]
MRLQRLPDGGILGGVCAGLADHLDADVWVIRVAFVLGALAGGIGAVAYVLLWLLTPAADPDPTAPDRPVWPLFALGALGVGLVLAVLGPSAAVALLSAVGGAALVWWHPDRSTDRTARGVLRLGLGLGLLVLGAVTFIAGRVGLSSLTAAVGTAAVLLGGAALVASPFVFGLVRDRDRERAERIAVRQRAEIAAHLHDSVLQTLALIQREHADPDAVLRLARAEERGLRTWLYGDAAAGHTPGLAERLQQAAAEVEQSEATVVEVVTVGDLRARTPATDAVVAASREAMLNAARHAADPEPVRVFARVNPDEVAVFIRDRGVGFDPDSLAGDRGGVRDSIVARIARTGGTTTIRSAPGAGTEVQIRMPL